LNLAPFRKPETKSGEAMPIRMDRSFVGAGIQGGFVLTVFLK
jgi:hypothetical protein